MKNEIQNLNPSARSSLITHHSSLVLDSILHTMLDRYEQRDRQRVVRVRINEREHSAYFSATDATPRRETNAALQQLADAGIIALHWRKWEDGNWLEAVDLSVERGALLYSRLGRTPRLTQQVALGELIDAQTPRAPWHAAFLAWAREQLAADRGIAPLDSADLRSSGDLLRALDAIAQLEAPTLQRNLSVRLFGDSKRLDALERSVIRVLRRHAANAADFEEDDKALLSAYHLDRVPEYVPVAGPLVLEYNAAQLDIISFLPSVALSATTLQTATVTYCSAEQIVTVENATSFSELTRVRPPKVLAIFSGGFASPTVLGLLQRIAVQRPDLPFYHWGDLDAGGLRILAHLRAHIPAVAPVAMDAATLEANLAHAQPLTPGDCAALAQLRDHPLLRDCVSLIDALLTNDRKLEQEALLAPLVVAQMTV